MFRAARVFLIVVTGLVSESNFVASVGNAASVSNELWDVIIVGGGVSGCVVADVVSESGLKTLLIESGDRSHASLGGTDVPTEWAEEARKNKRNLTRFDVPGEYINIAWLLQNYNQPTLMTVDFATGKKWAYQGNVLGGGGVVNGALAMRVPDTDFEAWREWEHLGWHADQVRPHVDAILHSLKVTETPSADGKRYLEPASQLLEKAFIAMNFSRQPVDKEPNMRADTYSYPPVAAVKGQRVSTCSVFLPKAFKRSNFKLMTKTRVKRMTQGAVRGHMDGVSVQEESAAERFIQLAAGGRIVLTAGALNTPYLLMASGVGPPDALNVFEATGEGTSRDKWILAPEVGRVLADHVLVKMRFRLDGYQAFRFADRPPQAISQYLTSFSGPYSQYGPLLTGYMRSPFAVEGTDADLEVYSVADDNDCKEEPVPVCRPDIFNVFLVLLRPRSSGSLGVQLQGPHAVLSPKEWGQLYLHDLRDQNAMVWGVKNVVEGMMKAHGSKLHLVSPAVANDNAYSTLVRDTWGVDSHLVGNHWSSTCKLGTCARPSDLAAQGTQNVHIADASLLPIPLSGHPWLTVAAVARRAAYIVARQGLAARRVGNASEEQREMFV